MWEDPIVAEVHRVRRELAEKFNFDVIAIIANIRQRQAALGPRIVSLAKPTEPAAEAKQGHDSDFSGVTSSGAAPAA
jgi:hypothetical protein